MVGEVCPAVDAAVASVAFVRNEIMKPSSARRTVGFHIHSNQHFDCSAALFLFLVTLANVAFAVRCADNCSVYGYLMSSCLRAEVDK